MNKVFSNPDVWCVRVPFVNLGEGESNCYIVRDGDACMVVDPGAASREGMDRVRAGLASLGIEPGMCDVFLTHTHFDHAEATRFLFPEGTRIYMSRVGFDEREPARAEAARMRFVERMVAMDAAAEDAEAYSRCDFEPTVLPDGLFDYRFLVDGDAVRVGRFAFGVVETPGHTLDHLCLVGRDGAPSFTGDEVLFGTTPCVDAPYGDEDALGLYLESLDAAGPRGVWMRRVSWVLPGHGDGFDGETLRARAAEIRERKLSHCERLRELEQANPFLNGEQLARRALTRKGEAAWHAATPMSRYYTLLEAYISLRHLHGSKGQSL